MLTGEEKDDAYSDQFCLLHILVSLLECAHKKIEEIMVGALRSVRFSFLHQKASQVGHVLERFRGYRLDLKVVDNEFRQCAERQALEDSLVVRIDHLTNVQSKWMITVLGAVQLERIYKLSNHIQLVACQRDEHVHSEF